MLATLVAFTGLFVFTALMALLLGGELIESLKFATAFSIVVSVIPVTIYLIYIIGC